MGFSPSDFSAFLSFPVAYCGVVPSLCSTAICYYLLNKYAPDSELYPKCPRGRARVDQVLATMTSTIQPPFMAFFVSVFPILCGSLGGQAPLASHVAAGQEFFAVLRVLLLAV